MILLLIGGFLYVIALLFALVLSKVSSQNGHSDQLLDTCESSCDCAIDVDLTGRPSGEAEVGLDSVAPNSRPKTAAGRIGRRQDSRRPSPARVSSEAEVATRTPAAP